MLVVKVSNVKTELPDLIKITINNISQTHIITK